MLVQSRTPKKSFVFLLGEKIRRAQIKKRKQNFSLVWRALASGGGAGQFRSKLVRAKFRIEHQKGNCKFERFASRSLSQRRRDSATNLYWILGEENFLIPCLTLIIKLKMLVVG